MWLPADLGRMMNEAVESLIRNPSSKTDFRPIGNQQVITNLMFPVWEQFFPLMVTMSRLNRNHAPPFSWQAEEQ